MNEVLENYDRGWDYDCELIIWVHCDKSFDEFTASLQSIVDPLTIENNRFNMGDIACRIEETTMPAPNFDNVPSGTYQFKVVVSTTGAIIWSYFNRQFALSLAIGIRTKFMATYLITNEENKFVLYSGTHKPNYLNPSYESWQSGELNAFRSKDDIEVGT